MDALSAAAFEERAAAAEARLATLEAALLGGGRPGGADPASLLELKELLTQAREAAVKQEDENSKLKYQVMHLKRALLEADQKLASLPAK